MDNFFLSAWLDTLPLSEYHTRMENNDTISIENGEAIWVWCSIHELWESGWFYLSQRGDGRHYAQADGITYVLNSEDIHELAGDF